MFSWDKPASTKRFSGNPYSKEGIEHSIARERQREREVSDMNRYVAQSMVSNQEAEQMKRAKGARRRNSSLARAAERQLEAKHTEEQNKHKHAINRKKDLALARQLAEIKRQEEKREREIQAICSQDPGLRELNEKIKAAYINKEREEQIAKQKARAAEIKREQARLEREMEARRQKGLVEMEEREEVRRQASERQRVEIQHQLRERQAQEQLQAILAYQKEKEQVEELIQSVYKQQRAEAEEMERQAALMKHNMEEGMIMQRQRRKMQEEREAEEERRIAEYKERVAHRNDAAEAEKAALEAAKDRIRQQIEDEMNARLAKEERMRDALHLLGKEEAERRRDEAERAKREKQYNMRQEMMNANEQQKRHKVVVREEEAEFENDILKRMQAKFDADEAAARRKEEQRRAAYTQYKQEVSHQMKERSDMFHAALVADAEQNKASREQEAYKAQVIEEARKRILQAHAAQLKGYLPKGVLQKAEDLQYLEQPRGQTR